MVYQYDLPSSQFIAETIDRPPRRKKLLAQTTFEGWVKNVEGDFALIELRTPQGLVELNIPREDFQDRIIPTYGATIRYKLSIETAPDLESDRNETNTPEIEGIQKLKCEPNRPGVYILRDK